MLQVSQELLQMYRERSGDPAFWAEPFNALSNASFLMAAAFAVDLAIRRQAFTISAIVLISIAGVIGCGSFLFHTIPLPLTKWLDILPIMLFQIIFLWLISRDLLSANGWIAAGVVIVVVGSSLALMPIRQPLNGSLFYIPSLVAMFAFGTLWAKRRRTEPFILLGGACCFAFAITARSIDWVVPWSSGTHFLWHLVNGIVVYAALRTWIVSITVRKVTGPSEFRSRTRRSQDLRA